MATIKELNKAISTLREFCYSQGKCKKCPLEEDIGMCALGYTPEDWENLKEDGEQSDETGND